MAFIAWHPLFSLPLPAGHRFPMIKYPLLREQLIYEGIVGEENFFAPDRLGEEYLRQVHCQEYSRRLFRLELTNREIRRVGFPLSKELIERELRIAQGTLSAAQIALSRGVSFNIAGGTHHAGSNWGEGFCLLNDQAIAARFLLDQYPIKQILIIDLDVHQGNGTAEIFRNEDRVFTFSMHGQNNFPFIKEQSDRDVGLPDGTGGAEYLHILNWELKKWFFALKPDFVFFQAGVDVLYTDRMGKLRLSRDDCKERDRLVFQYCKTHGVPLQVSMGGGYSGQVKDIVDAHANTFRMGIDLIL